MAYRVWKKLNNLSEKAKLISTEKLTKDLTNKYSILNSAKYFFQMDYKYI